MKDLDTIFNIIYKFIFFVAVMTAITSPETVGEWQARSYIAYDTLWLEYIGECDCTEPHWGE